MQIPDAGDIVTPIDDPCQFDPAWRSCVAQYLHFCGVRSKEDLECLSKTGGIYVSIEDIQQGEEDVSDGKKAKKRGNASKKKPEKPRKPKKAIRPLFPFDSSAEYRCFAMDQWIIGMVQLLEAISLGEKSTPEDACLRLAKRWYEEIDHEAAMKKRIEPLLLTGIGMDVITMDLIGKPSAQPAIEAYERLYFNCRDEEWGLNSSAQLIQRMATPYGPLKTFMRKHEELDEDGFVVGDGRPLAKASDVWKAIAASLGYDALMYTWKWDRFAHGMKDRSVENILDLSWKVAASQLFTALYTGDIAHEDAARLLSAYTAQAKKISDDKNCSTGNEEEDTTKALLSILRLTSPKMVAFSSDDDKSMNEEIQSRIQSQLAISKQTIEDKGAQVNKEVMDAQIANAISV